MVHLAYEGAGPHGTPPFAIELPCPFCLVEREIEKES